MPHTTVREPPTGAEHVPGGRDSRTMQSTMPILFPIRDSDREALNTLGVYSPGCGRGWWPLVTRLLDGIIAHNAPLPEPGPESAPDVEPPAETPGAEPGEESEEGPRPARRVTVAQIKEKFGTLRFYVDGDVPERLADAISAAEHVSTFVCETCGQPGSERCPTGWVYTACDACFQGSTVDRQGASEASSEHIPPYYHADDPAWWTGGSVWHVLAFAAQSRDEAERERALQRLAWLRHAKGEASAGDWRKMNTLDEWALAIADAHASATTLAYPEPLQTMLCLLATGLRPDGSTATHDQILALLQHANPTVRVAAQMSFALKGPVVEIAEVAPSEGRSQTSPPARTA